MKVWTRLIAIAATMLMAIAVGTVPAAASGSKSRDSDHPAYWEATYPQAVSCYKSTKNTAHGKVTSGRTGVTLNAFHPSWPGDRWEVLIVKGSGPGDDGKGNAIYELPTAGTAYLAPPAGSGGKGTKKSKSTVSHWIVCKGSTPTPPPTFDDSWSFANPTCEALTVKWPKKLPQAARTAGVTVRDVATDQTVTLEWTSADASGFARRTAHTFVYADHPDWPGWTHYTIESARADGTTYQWTGAVTCGEPSAPPAPPAPPAPVPPAPPAPPVEPVEVCVWDDDAGRAVKEIKDAYVEGDVPWGDGSECTPIAVICVWTGDLPIQQTVLVTELTDEMVPWTDGSECTPTVLICVVDGDSWAALEIPVTGLRDGDLLWDGDASGCVDRPRVPDEPAVVAAFLNSVCMADAPWLHYAIEVVDPGRTIDPDRPATVTFENPAPEGEDYVFEVLPGTGSVLWPGAEVEPAEGLTVGDINPRDPSTFVPTSWPGWEQGADGDWVNVGDDNYGWTREGVTVRVDVNPTYSVQVNYPPASPVCDASPRTPVPTPPVPVATPPVPVATPPVPVTVPPTQAPPAQPVPAEVTYAG